MALNIFMNPEHPPQKTKLSSLFNQNSDFQLLEACLKGNMIHFLMTEWQKGE